MKKKNPPKTTTLPETWGLEYRQARLEALEELYRYELAQARPLPKADAKELRELKARRHLLVHGNRQKP